MYTAGRKLDLYPEYNTYMPQVGPGRAGNQLRNEQDAKYIVTTKIMVLALAVLFAVVFFLVCLHIYAKWIWRATPARGSPSFSFWPIRRRRNRASPGDEIVLDADVLDINMVMGLGKSAVEALPKFRYKTTDHVKSAEIGDWLECAICLRKFEEDEMGRALPKCGHSFHLECIDMWLYSHSTCPLCRAILEPDEDESISLNFETPSIQIFHLEPTTGTTPRRLRGADSADHNLLPQLLPARDRTPPEPLAESDQQPPQPEDTANKRADAIPANVLFWGTQASAESRLSTVVNNNSPRAPSQLVIDIDVDLAEPNPHHDPRPNSTGAPILMPRSAAAFHRLLGHARLPAPPADDVGVEMSVRPFRPSPWPSSPSQP